MILYHYTTGQNLVQIIESGYLIPSAAGGKPGEVPLLWFSKSKDYEPTALKMMQTAAGQFFILTPEQQRELVGNVRFALDTEKFHVMPWPTACKTAGISNRERKTLERVGADQGGNCKNWFATDDYLPVWMLRVEVETDHGWMPLEEAAA